MKLNPQNRKLPRSRVYKKKYSQYERQNFHDFLKTIIFYVFLHNISCKLWYLCDIVALLHAPGCVEAKICDVFIKAFMHKHNFPWGFASERAFFWQQMVSEKRKHLAKATDDCDAWLALELNCYRQLKFLSKCCLLKFFKFN